MEARGGQAKAVEAVFRTRLPVAKDEAGLTKRDLLDRLKCSPLWTRAEVSEEPDGLKVVSRSGKWCVCGWISIVRGTEGVEVDVSGETLRFCGASDNKWAFFGAVALVLSGITIPHELFWLLTVVAVIFIAFPALWGRELARRLVRQIRLALEKR